MANLFSSKFFYVFYFWFCTNLLQAEQRPVTTPAQRYLIGYMIGVVVLLTGLFILFFIVFQRRKNQLLIDKIKQQQAFDKEMQQAQTEIQEQTLKNIGWELHDNVGQLLAYANMQMNMLNTQVDEKIKPTVKATSETIKQSLEEVRALSKSLNNEALLNMGLEKSIRNEVKRLRKMKFDLVEFDVTGEVKPLEDKKHEVILFRILQEFFSNSVKYSEAKELHVHLDYSHDNLVIQARDNGKGFDMSTIEMGSGLLNMKSRAELIQAKFDLKSQPGQGSQLNLIYSVNCPGKPAKVDH
ncbi:sensor histidine kinase [Mangrovimonas futianensis]|uniref:sensor histidine kinase n=1 Tax=Mangrovimonas futianensis TaxID=2895523 RepID=UPI001E2BEA0E|nr:sensor histidine kinase [Mangrovimonas futianensis]MCF1196300.1 sensor histidine kinase [Mangrovimonas futianensis]